MEIAVIIVIIVIAIVLLVATLTRNKQTVEEVLVNYSYISKKQIMTSAEKVFYDKLLATLGSNHYIVPQAHLSTFIDHKIKGQSWKAAFSVINGKSVDFLVVEKMTQKPILAIELDDYTHYQPDRIKRDAIVQEILQQANIPLERYASNQQVPILEIIRKTQNPT